MLFDEVQVCVNMGHFVNKVSTCICFVKFLTLYQIFVLCLQGEKDWAKYETARKLKKCVEKIRANYREDFKSKEMRIRQRAVALYFIDKVR